MLFVDLITFTQFFSLVFVLIEKINKNLSTRTSVLAKNS